MKCLGVFIAGLLGLGIVSATAAVIDLPSSGWYAQWSDTNNSRIAVTDLGTSGGVGDVGLTLIFDDQSFQSPGFFDPLPITFVQSSAGAASQIVVHTTLVNHSSVALGGLKLKLLGGDGVHFDVSAMNIGGSGGLNVTPFTATFTPDHRQMDLSNGNLPSGKTYVLSRDGGLIVGSPGTSSNSPNAFALKIQPSSAVPEPGMLGVAALTCLGILTRTRQKH